MLKEINETEGVTFDDCDIFFIGGGSDREQALTTKELSKIKTSLKNAIEDGAWVNYMRWLSIFRS